MTTPRGRSATDPRYDVVGERLARVESALEGITQMRTKLDTLLDAVSRVDQSLHESKSGLQRAFAVIEKVEKDTDQRVRELETRLDGRLKALESSTENDIHKLTESHGKHADQISKIRYGIWGAGIVATASYALIATLVSGQVGSYERASQTITARVEAQGREITGLAQTVTALGQQIKDSMPPPQSYGGRR